MGDRTREVIEYARANGGIITTNQARALGMDRRTLARRVQAGVLDRVTRGVLILPGTTVGFEPDLQAACRKLNGVVSHQSAGQMHRFDGLPWAAPTITVPHRLTHEFPGVRVHQSTDIDDDQVVTVRGLPVTSPERTVIDLAAVLKESRLDFVFDRALSSGTVDLSALSDLFASLARRGKPGTAAMRRMLEKRSQGYLPPDTVLEQRLLELIRKANLPLPTPQFRPDWLAPKEGRVDFAYPDRRLIVEADSRKWHLLMESFELDRERDNLAQIAGWRVLRFAWRDVVDRPDYVIDTIAAALAG